MKTHIAMSWMAPQDGFFFKRSHSLLRSFEEGKLEDTPTKVERRS